MPQLNISIGKAVTKEQLEKLQLAIGGIMPLIPGKNIDNTVISVNSGLDMYKGGARWEGAFVDVRLYKSSPEEAKEEFYKKLCEVFAEVLSINASHVQANFIELPKWAAGGRYF